MVAGVGVAGGSTGAAHRVRMLYSLSQGAGSVAPDFRAWPPGVVDVPMTTVRSVWGHSTSRKKAEAEGNGSEAEALNLPRSCRVGVRDQAGTEIPRGTASTKGQGRREHSTQHDHPGARCGVRVSGCAGPGGWGVTGEDRGVGGKRGCKIRVAPRSWATDKANHHKNKPLFPRTFKNRLNVVGARIRAPKHM